MTDRPAMRLLPPAFLFPTGVMALAAIVCFFRLDIGSIWNDEAFSFFVSWRGVHETLELVQRDTQPPLYYLVLTAWLHLGHSPFVLRALSATAAVAAAGLLVGAGRRLFGAPVAILAGVLFALDGSVVEWGQRARPYALQAGFAALAFWGFARIWDADDRRPGRLAWAGYVAGGAMAVLTQYPVGFMLVGLNAAMAWRIFRDLRRYRPLLWRWIGAQLALTALCCLWLPNFLRQMSADLTPAAIEARHGIYLISADQLLGALSGLLSVSKLWSYRLPFLLAFALAAMLGLRAALQTRQGVPLLAVIAVALGIWLLGWRFLHPLFGYVAASSVWFILPYSLVLALGVRSLPRPAGAALMAALCLGDLVSLANLYRLPTVPLDRAAALIAPQIGPRDGILFGNRLGGRWGLAYYLGPPYAGRLRGLDLLDVSNFEHAPDPGQKVPWLIQAPSDTDGLDRLWVFTPSAEQPLLDPALALPGSAPAYGETLPGLSLRRFDRVALTPSSAQSAEPGASSR